MFTDAGTLKDVHQHVVRGAIVIGASTGGPEALTSLLRDIPRDIQFPILIAQHLPGSFADSFVQRLSKVCQVPVIKMTMGLAIQAGHIYLAPGGFDVKVNRMPETNQVITHIVPTESIQSPSVDLLMKSVAVAFGSNSIGIILTGMGSDGLEGIRAIKHAGGIAIVQSEATSVVYGMGKQVFDAHLSDFTLPLPAIARHAVLEMRHKLGYA